MADDRDGDNSFWAALCPPPRRESNVIQLRPAQPALDQADTAKWAERIRARMGWHREDDKTRTVDLRELALRQVAESRAGRF